MIRRRAMLLMLICPLGARPTLATTTEQTVDIEIDHLIQTVASAPCKFQRNGAWYDGRQAAAHLREKFVWMQHLGQIHTAEEFIIKVATTSSASGQAYVLRCPGEEPIDTASWLYSALATFRRAPTRSEAGHRPW